MDGGANQQGEGSSRHAEGHPCAGESRGGATEGRARCGKADAAELVRTGIEETLYHYAFPHEHRQSLRTNNRLERILREVRRISALSWFGLRPSRLGRMRFTLFISATLRHLDYRMMKTHRKTAKNFLLTPLYTGRS